MFTDIVGYTALGQENESAALELLERHRQLLRPLFSKHAGHEIKSMGDAFLVEFSSALEATLCAIDIQSTVHSRNLERGEKLQVRIGIHVGDVMHQGGDVLGDAVNVASRIEPLAAPGGICISEQVQDHIKNKVSYPLTKIQVGQPKNVREPLDVYKVVLPWDERETKAEMAPKLDRHRVAILPFANISPDPADEYFADGLTEELIGTMSKIRELRVISHTSVMQYKGRSKPVPEIGRELNAGTILEGSVRKAGNRIRVSIQMIEANEDEHLWAENYDREIQDIFLVQSDIASRVADALKMELLADERKGIEKVPTDNVNAHNLYLKGGYYFDKGSPSDMEKGIEYYELACEQDPGFALAYARAAIGYVGIAGESMSPSEAFPKAKQLLAKALSLDDELADAHFVQSAISFQYDWDWAATEKSAKRAISLNSSLASGHNVYSWLLSMLGRFDEAITEANLAYELDPASPFTGYICAIVNWMAGKDDMAREYCRQLLKIHPDFARAHQVLALLNATESKAEEAIRESEEMIRISGESLFRESQAQVYAFAGQIEKAREILNGLLSGKFRGYVSPMHVGLIYYSLGDMENGYLWIEKAYEARDPGLPYTCKWPVSNVAMKDPRFVELLHRINIPS